MPTINGTPGNDTLIGTVEDDLFVAGEGNDAIYGMDGSDIIRDLGGAYTYIDAGAGNDHIFVDLTGSVVGDVTTIIGGAGHDSINFSQSGAGRAVIDFGAGPGNLSLGSTPQGGLTLNLSDDQYFMYYPSDTLTKNYSFGTITINGFTPGRYGDLIDVYYYALEKLQPAGWYFNESPFTSGLMRLKQVGANTVLQVDEQGNGSFTDLIIFTNTQAGEFNPYNFFSDYRAQDWAISGPAGGTITGDANDNVLFGGPGDDTLTGGLGADTFVMSARGRDTITDFSVADDRLDLSTFGILYLADALSLARQVGTDVVLRLGPGNGLVLQGVQLSSLTSANFAGLETGNGVAVLPPSEPESISIFEAITGFASHTIAAGETLFWRSPGPMFAHASDGTLVNDGTIWASGVGSVSIIGHVSTITNNGSIYAVASGGGVAGGASGIGYEGHPDSGFSTLNNNGTIAAVGWGHGGSSIGVQSYNFTSTINNSGIISARGEWRPIAVQFGNQTGSWGYGTEGFVNNLTAGQILAEGSGAIGIRFVRANSTADAAQLNNAGLIQAVTTSSDPSLAIYFDQWGSGYAGVFNSGTISADIAFYSEARPARLTNDTGGDIFGDIIFAAQADVLTNRGTITGEVLAGAGADVVDTASGQIIGAIHLEQGDDQFAGGASLDDVRGGSGNDVLAGNGGNDLIDGGIGLDSLSGGSGSDRIEGGFSDDVLDGGTGNDGLYGGTGNDTLRTLAGDVARGGWGDDRLETGDYSFSVIDGGEGYDHWVLPSGPRSIDLGLVAASGRVIGVEGVELAGNQQLVIRETDVAAFSGFSTLYLRGSSSDQVYLVGQWSANGTVVNDGLTWTSYVSQIATVFVQAGVTATIGTSPPTASGLDAIAGGEAAPAPTDGWNDNDQVVSAGVVTSNLIISAEETWRSADRAAVLEFAPYTNGGIWNHHPDIVNWGQIISEVAVGYEAIAVGGNWNTSFGTFVNHGLIRAEIATYGDAYAFLGVHRGVVENEGEIHAINHDAGYAVALTSWDWNPPTNGAAVVNRGDIWAYSQSGFALGVQLNANATLNNSGIIEAAGGDGATAVQTDNAPQPGRVENSGLILATVDADSESAAVGVHFSTRGSLVNSGTIHAEIAVWAQFGGFDPHFSLLNTGTIEGAIYVTNQNPNDPFGGSPDPVAITNYGEIYGSIIMNQHTVTIDSVVNNGLIAGDVYLAKNHDSYDGSLGEVWGSVYGEAGNDKLTGGQASDLLFGGDGNDNLTGNAGDDFLDGGVGADVVDGGAGNDRIVYDAADNPSLVTGGAGTDTLVINGAAGPTGVNLAAQGFERAEVIQTDTGGNPWSTIVSHHNANWALVQRVTTNDDGSRIVVDVDANNTANTSQVWSAFDAQGRLSSFDRIFDDGTRIFINLDEAGTQSWTQDWFAYDAQGRLSSQDRLFDDGSRTFINLDEAGTQSWAQDWFAYDAQGRLSSQDRHFDNGTRTFINLDEAGTQAWAQNWFTYDAQGRLSSEDRLFDDGTRTFVNLDEDNSQSWSQAWFTYDAQGRLDTQDVLYDDGSRIFYNYDQGSTEPFQINAMLYNASGTAYQQVITWDDGSVSYIML